MIRSMVPQLKVEDGDLDYLGETTLGWEVLGPRNEGAFAGV